MTALDNNDINDFLLRYPGWRYEDNLLKSEFRFADFRQALDFISNVSNVAEELDHHPDWRNIYNRVEVALTTYSIKALSSLDIMLASAMERQYEAYKHH